MGYPVDKVIAATKIWQKDKNNVDFRAVDLMEIIFKIEDGEIDLDKINQPTRREIRSESEPAKIMVAGSNTDSPEIEKQQQPVEKETISAASSNIDLNETDDKYESNEEAERNSNEMESMSSLKEENKRLREMTICKICMDNTVDVVFLPCGHIASCHQCAPALKKCPICRGKVKGVVKAYLA